MNDDGIAVELRDLGMRFDHRGDAQDALSFGNLQHEQRQAEAEPALLALERAVGLGEQIEDVRQEIGGDADAAMYMAKSRGKNRIVVFEPGMHRAALTRSGAITSAEPAERLSCSIRWSSRALPTHSSGVDAPAG